LKFGQNAEGLGITLKRSEIKLHTFLKFIR